MLRCCYADFIFRFFDIADIIAAAAFSDATPCCCRPPLLFIAFDAAFSLLPPCHFRACHTLFRRHADADVTLSLFSFLYLLP